MPEKKKTAAVKNTERRMTKPQASKTAKNPEPARMAVAASTSGAAVAQSINSQKQLGNFEAAMKLFHVRKLKEARGLFEQSAQGPERDVAQRSRLHIAMCDRRLLQPTVSLRSPEDYYNYGVALINTRNLTEALAHLEKAADLVPNADHVQYALALAKALSGDHAAAHDHLKRAIEIDPRNRAIARQDADFAPLANQHPFDALLYPEKKTW